MTPEQQIQTNPLADVWAVRRNWICLCLLTSGYSWSLIRLAMNLTFHNIMHRQLQADDPHPRINLDTFPFFTREIGPNGKTIANKCGRDFLAHACAHLRPQEFVALGLKQFERAIGWPTPPSLVWTGLPFIGLIDFLNRNNLELSINDALCRSRIDLWKALWWPKKISHLKALSIAHAALSKKCAVGIDISMGLNGLANHVMYVWAIRDNDMIVFDTHKVRGLEYEHLLVDADGLPLYPEKFVMRLPLSVIENRWKRWNRVWVMRKKSLERPIDA